MDTEIMMNRYHHPEISPNQCGSSVRQAINAPISLVWSLIRQFDNPQRYKQFIKTCSILYGDGGIGSVREVELISSFPDETSRERLDELDDDSHVMVFSIVGGEILRRLINFRSTITAHVVDDKDPDHDEDGKTMVIESYVVDVPMGNTKEEACLFNDTILKCNLRCLASISEKMASVFKTGSTTEAA